jgi:predicted Zn finger-like uncharacterized protein
MILTCPECATRYFLHDVLVGRAGRKVKCTACGATWVAQAEDEPVAAPQSDDLVVEPALGPAAEPAPAIPAEDTPAEDEFSAAVKLRAEVRAAELEKQRRKRQAATATGAVWAGILVAVALLVALAAVFRAEVARVWPGSAGLFAAAGLPVNPTGLVVQQVRAVHVMQDGVSMVVVRGVLRNVAGRAVPVPPLRIGLMDAAGRPLARRIAGGGGPMMRPGETRPFSLAFPSPATPPANVEVGFALTATRAPTPTAAALPPPVDAVALPPNPPAAPEASR